MPQLHVMLQAPMLHKRRLAHPTNMLLNLHMSLLMLREIIPPFKRLPAQLTLKILHVLMLHNMEIQILLMRERHRTLVALEVFLSHVKCLLVANHFEGEGEFAAASAAGRRWFPVDLLEMSRMLVRCQLRAAYGARPRLRPLF